MKSDHKPKVKQRTKLQIIAITSLVLLVTIGAIRFSIAFTHNPTHVPGTYLGMMKYIILASFLSYLGLQTYYRKTKHRWL